MRLKTLIQKLQELEKQGLGNRPITIDVGSCLEHYEAGDPNMFDVTEVKREWCENVDGDGFQIYNKDGSGSGRSVVALKSNYHD